MTNQSFVKSISPSNIVFINQLSDLPPSSGGVITLVDELTYWFTTHIDLLGSRLVCGENTTILGSSSENCSITSTDLPDSVALITTVYTMPMRHITIKDVETALDIDGFGSITAYDWTGVNFENVQTVGIIKNASNFIFSKGAFLNSKGLIFDGIFDTIGFDNSLLQSDGLVGSIISVSSTATINRRIRIIYSSLIVTALSSGIDVNVSATLPVEGFILDTVNFSGGASYITGVQFNDNKALFLNCRGISNSTETSQYYMNGNTTTTTIVSSATPTKVAGNTINSSITQKFVNTNNRSTYIGALSRVFSVTATLSCTSGNNNQVGSYIAKNGAVLPQSEVYITTNGSGRFEGCTIQTLIELATNDYIEVFVENNTGAVNILVTDLNTVIR